MVMLMKNKVLITLIVPTLMETYDVYIPVNERISKIKELVINSISEFTENEFDKSKEYNLINAKTGTIYKNSEIVRDTDITNSTKILIN